MAMLPVEMVLKKLAALFAEEAQLLGGVPRGINQLREDLESMKSFLQDAEARSENDEGIRTWVKQVRDVAYDTEDVLADFSVRLSTPPVPQNHIIHCITTAFHHLRRLRTRHQLGLQIQDIRHRIKAISERKNAFCFQSNDETTSSNIAVQMWHDPRTASLFIDEADVVGIETPRCLLVSWLTTGEQSLTTVLVVGMGGLGKTTLVKKTYDCKAVKKHFDCHHTWITVSKSFTAAEILQTAFKGFLEAAKQPVPEGIDRMSELELVNKLKSYLQEKRYVVVLDDIWSINAWDSVKFAFPDCKCGSRIIFTTRISDVVKDVENNSLVYNLKPLPEKEAWTLFCRKAFRGEQNGVCPEELVEISRKILKKCGGLPLAITAIGGLLSKKNKLVLEWNKIRHSLKTEMKSNSVLESLEKIILLSYKDLPYHLKCCYLYLSVFPEDYLIKRMKLVRLWVVERFVEEKPGLTQEEVAEEYLNEFVSRSMIQVVYRDPFNRVHTCQVHDLMRELIQLRSRGESLVMIQSSGETLSDKVRRIAIHDHCEGFPSASTFRCLRSLLVFVPKGSSVSFGNSCFYGFKLLRVLELEGAPLEEFPEEIVGMIHLRYLSLRKTHIRKLPESIGKLKNLEILDLKGSLVSSIPNGILRLEHLVQLRNYSYYFETSSFIPKSLGMKVPTGIGRLTSLQKLGSVEMDSNDDVVIELGKLTQLKRLGVLKLRQQDGIGLCSSLERLKQLTALYMDSTATNEVLSLDSLSSPPRFLQRLFLKCKVATLPKWIESLPFLAKLVLQNCNLNNDPLKSLQQLPNLVILEIREESYEGKELCCDAGGYPRLKKLMIYGLNELKCVRVEEGAMPGLRELHLISCVNLETVPLGIEHLVDLQDLGVWYMPRRFRRRLEGPQGEDFLKIQHITTIQGLEST